MFNNDGPWENTTIGESDPSDFQKVKDENEVCDCDPEHKETKVIQSSRGANFGGFGGQFGDGTTVIVCKNCGGRFYEEEENGRIDSGLSW